MNENLVKGTKNTAILGTSEAKKSSLKPVPKINEEHFLDGSLLNKDEQKDIADWQRYLVVEKPIDILPLLVFGSAPIWTQGNHSLIIGKKKSRKTLFVVWLIGEYIKQGRTIEDILVCDTEQGSKHVWKVREKIFKLTGQWVNILSLRGLNIDQRKEIIEQAIKDNSFKVVVIDGIRDLLSNINDPDQSTDLIIWIEHLTVTYNLHIVNILHQNKTDNNARGHLGSELLNKAEITIELELDEKAGCTIVKCESSRDIPFESFAFTHNTEELPEVVSMPSSGQSFTDSHQKERLKAVFESGQLKYQDVIDGIKNYFKIGTNKAGHLLADYLIKGWVVKNGKDRHPDTVYKLMINA
jgi:hypothetical protein